MVNNIFKEISHEINNSIVVISCTSNIVLPILKEVLLSAKDNNLNDSGNDFLNVMEESIQAILAECQKLKILSKKIEQF